MGPARGRGVGGLGSGCCLGGGACGRGIPRLTPRAVGRTGRYQGGMPLGPDSAVDAARCRTHGPVSGRDALGAGRAVGDAPTDAARGALPGYRVRIPRTRSGLRGAGVRRGRPRVARRAAQRGMRRAARLLRRRGRSREVGEAPRDVARGASGECRRVAVPSEERQGGRPHAPPRGPGGAVPQPTEPWDGGAPPRGGGWIPVRAYAGVGAGMSGLVSERNCGVLPVTHSFG